MDTEGKIVSEIEGKPSTSEYQIIATVNSKRFSRLNLVKLNLISGRRHQLRIHLASINNPILGDKDYGKEGLILNGKGLYLHAYCLQFTHPFTKEMIDIKDDFPKRFTKLFPLTVEAITG